MSDLRDDDDRDEATTGSTSLGSGADARLDRALGRAWRDDRAWELVTELTRLESRMGASPGERRAATLVREGLEAAGVDDVRTDEFPVQRWERGDAEFAVVEPVERSFEAIALPYSPAGDVDGPLVDVGHGTPEEIDEAGDELRGAIALASTTTPPGRRFVHRMEKFGRAVAAGAEAFVFANHVPGQLPPTGALRFDAEAAVPGVGVSAETADWLREYAAEGGRARLRVDARTGRATSRNVHGVLGPDADEAVVVLAHYDAHDVAEGALDNACGIATVVAAASVLERVEDDLERRVRIAGVGCEEIGLLGAAALADELPLEDVHGVVNVDGAGRFRDLRALSHGSDSLEALADRVATALGQPIARDPDPHPFSDHWPFLRQGVPSVQLHSEPPEGGERGRGWGHTAADTRDKVDPRNLREHGMLTALLVRDLARTDVPRIDASDLRAALREQDYEPGMRAAEIWPDAWS